jgi:hypothetical protein
MLPTATDERGVSLKVKPILTIIVADLSPIRRLGAVPPCALQIPACGNSNLERPVKLESIIKQVVVVSDRADRADNELVALDRLQNSQILHKSLDKGELTPISPFR